jgi:hypothetical protein
VGQEHPIPEAGALLNPLILAGDPEGGAASSPADIGQDRPTVAAPPQRDSANGRENLRSAASLRTQERAQGSGSGVALSLAWAEDMNTMERVLADDLARLIDRLAASIPEGAFERVCTMTPALRARLDQLDATLAAAHGSLVEAYERWARALDDLENVWALAAWRSALEEPVENAPRLAA